MEPEAYVDAPMEMAVVSVGKMLGSLILPTIHFCTRLMYWIAGILMGFLLLSSHVYVCLLVLAGW